MELPYLKETRKWDMTMLGTGSTLNLYLIQKKSSQINALVGFIPSIPNWEETAGNGEANLNLKCIGRGETTG
jgi:hypothetical protein